MEITATNQEKSLAYMQHLTKDKLQENLLLVSNEHCLCVVFCNVCMNLLESKYSFVDVWG